MSEVYYISGKISDNDEFPAAFFDAESKLQDSGKIVLTPTMLPEGMKSERYLPICLAMIDSADVVYMLKNWRDSAGAGIEHAYAMYQHKKIVYERAEVPI